MRPIDARGPRYRRRHEATIAEVRGCLALITEDEASCIEHMLGIGEAAMAAGLMLATKSGAWLEQKVAESTAAASTLAEIQIAVALHADRMEAVAGLLRAAETRAQLALLATAGTRQEYARVRAEFLTDRPGGDRESGHAKG